MTLKILAVSTATNTSNILKRLETYGQKEISIELHIGNTQDDIKASALTRMNNKSGRLPHIFKESRFSSSALDLMKSDDFHKNMEQFIEHLHRRSEVNSYKSHKIYSLGDYSDYYHILADCVAELIDNHRINCCLFFNIPHLTYDTIIYQVAKSKNIRTIILTQSLFSNKFFSMKSIEDNGHLEKINKKYFPSLIKINNQEKDYFYMKGIKQEKSIQGRINVRAIANIFMFIFMHRPKKLIDFKYIYNILKRSSKIYKNLPNWRDPYSKFFHEDSLSYFEHIIEFEDKKFDLKRKYIYFPLQLQPEMTTSSIGGIYRDQAFAIESLSAILPEDVTIYVKENPKQSAYMRGPMFFHRLNRIKNVEFLPSWANTHELTKKSVAVATITGTVGWEAMQLGKPAIVFGIPWYRRLPGVIAFDPKLRWADIENKSFEKIEIENAANFLISRAHDGVIDRHYEAIVEKFDPQKNIDNTAQTILKIIKGDIEFTFNSTSEI